MCRTPPNVDDSQPAMPLLDRVPALPTAPEKPKKPVRAVLRDKAYGTPRNEEGCRRRCVASRLARPREPLMHALAKVRWGVEQSLSWFNNPPATATVLLLRS